jgi:hypothetical protein
MYSTTNSLIAHIDASNDLLTAYSWSGSAFSIVGSALSITVPDNQDPYLIAMNENTVLLSDGDDGIIKAYRFSGSVWSNLCNYTINNTSVGSTLIRISREEFLAHDNSFTNFELFKYDDSLAIIYPIGGVMPYRSLTRGGSWGEYGKITVTHWTSTVRGVIQTLQIKKA